MNKTAKIIISFLVLTIIELIVLLTMLTIRHLNICKIAGAELKSVELHAEEIWRKDRIEEDNKKDIQLVKLSLENVTANGATIIIKDNNEKTFNWTENYKIKKKINDEYIDLDGKSDFDLTEITLDQNGEYKQVIDWTDRYGVLEKGVYVIEKTVITTNSAVDFMTEEFEIK